jgi:hypothetical protein
LYRALFIGIERGEIGRRPSSSLQQEELVMATLSTDAPITPLRKRMQHDMLMRGLGPHLTDEPLG